MYSNNHRGLSEPIAIIIGAIIGACAMIAAAVIGVAFGRFEINLGAVAKPTQVAETDTLRIVPGSPAPQPTYTLLPTYTPYPMLKPNVTVVTPNPIIVTTTPSADQQNPPPSSIIPVGQGYTRNGITITLGKSMVLGSDFFSIPPLTIENKSGQQIAVLWKNSFYMSKMTEGKHSYSGMSTMLIGIKPSNSLYLTEEPHRSKIHRTAPTVLGLLITLIAIGGKLIHQRDTS